MDLKRCRNLMRLLKADGLPGLLLGKAVNITYLTGFTGDSSFLLVTPKKVILLSDERFRIQLQDECPGLEVAIRGHNKNTYQLMAEVLAQFGLTDLGIEAAGFTVADFELMKSLCPKVNFVPKSGYVEKLRVIKDAEELATIKHAISIAQRAYLGTTATIIPTETETQLANRLDMTVRSLGGSGLAFPPIVGVGPRAALPHCPVGDTLMNQSPFVLIDWGAKYLGYHSDLTRVIPSPGQTMPKAMATKLRKIYEIVAEAQRRAIAHLHPGVSVKEVDRQARGYIESQGYGKYFQHGLGHGIGLEIHEGPSIRMNSNDELQAGMVVTIEPGIYLPDFGGVRIEDDILITDDGPVPLTNVPKDWEQVFGS